MFDAGGSQPWAAGHRDLAPTRRSLHQRNAPQEGHQKRNRQERGLLASPLLDRPLDDRIGCRDIKKGLFQLCARSHKSRSSAKFLEACGCSNGDEVYARHAVGGTSGFASEAPTSNSRNSPDFLRLQMSAPKDAGKDQSRCGHPAPLPSDGRKQKHSSTEPVAQRIARHTLSDPSKAEAHWLAQVLAIWTTPFGTLHMLCSLRPLLSSRLLRASPSPRPIHVAAATSRPVSCRHNACSSKSAPADPILQRSGPCERQCSGYVSKRSGCGRPPLQFGHPT